MRSTIVTIFLFHVALACWGQGTDSPVQHMSYLADREAELQKNYLGYMSEVAHGKRARKMEKRRQELIVSIQQSIRDGGKLKPYKGDASLRTAFLDYWNILLHIFREDYHKIVDMEEVAEQSYDMMEAMMIAQEQVDQKLSEAYGKIPPAYEAFAAKHNVTLTKGEDSKISKKLGKVGKVNNYTNKMFLIYFKSSVQENNLAAAINKQDINAVEQSRNAMISYAKEGLLKLDTMHAFDNDQSLLNACRKALQFHLDEGEKRIPVLAQYLIDLDEFSRIKKSFDAKPANKRTKEDIDQYNNKVALLNKSAENFNKQSEQLFNDRVRVAEAWENARKNFMDKHMPYK